MGSVIFTDTHSSFGIASATYDVKVDYSESYDQSTKKSAVKITGVSIRKRSNTVNWGILTVYGSITINGTTVISMNGGSAYTCHLLGSDYCPVTISGSSTVYVDHDPVTGEAIMTLSVVAGINSGSHGDGRSYFCGYYYYYNPTPSEAMYIYAGVPTSTKNVNLITRASTLSINPDGGIWENSSSVRTFSQVVGSTKVISNPTKNGYSFAGWILSGGGSIYNGIYTFGDTNGVLIANWVPGEYTLHISGDSGAEIHVYKDNVELFDGDEINYGDTITLSINAKPGYKIISRSPLSDNVIVSDNLTISVVTAPMSTIHIRRTGVWEMYLIYKRKNGQWELYQANIRISGQWEKYF